MNKAYQHYQNAIALRDRILAGQTNETPVKAWAAVCRECANAEYQLCKLPHDEAGTRQGRSFLKNLNAVWWYAKAQRENIAAVNMQRMAA